MLKTFCLLSADKYVLLLKINILASHLLYLINKDVYLNF